MKRIMMAMLAGAVMLSILSTTAFAHGHGGGHHRYRTNAVSAPVTQSAPVAPQVQAPATQSAPAAPQVQVGPQAPGYYYYNTQGVLSHHRDAHATCGHSGCYGANRCLVDSNTCYYGYGHCVR